MNSDLFSQGGPRLQECMNRIFDGLEQNDSNYRDAIRCVAELTLFENRLRGNYRLSGKHLIPELRSRLRKLLGLREDQDLPKHFDKGVLAEVSSLFSREIGRAHV